VTLGLGALAFEYDTLELFEYNELLVRVVDFGVALLFAYQEPGLFKPFEFTLDIAGVLFDKLGQTADVGFEIWVLSIDHNNLATHS
jgi:hypothetical protein